MKKFFFILLSFFLHIALFFLFFDLSETFFPKSQWKGTNTPLVLNPIFVELSVEKDQDPWGGPVGAGSKPVRNQGGLKTRPYENYPSDPRLSQQPENGIDKNGPSSEEAPNLLALIRKKIAERQTYPHEALEHGLSGTVKVTFKINTNGALDYAKISSSSGSQILDDSALLAVKRSAPLPYFPHAITLPIAYELK